MDVGGSSDEPHARASAPELPMARGSEPRVRSISPAAWGRLSLQAGSHDVGLEGASSSNVTVTRAAEAHLSRLRKARVQAIAAVASGEVVVAASAVEAARIPLAKQGDIRTYTETALVSRAMLREDKDVRAAVQEQFEVLTRHLDPAHRTISSETYTRYFLLCARLLDPTEFASSSNLRQLADQLQVEWEKDRQGHPAMTDATFFDAVFELVDQWTSTVDLKEYLALLQTILVELQCAASASYFHSDTDMVSVLVALPVLVPVTNLTPTPSPNRRKQTWATASSRSRRQCAKQASTISSPKISPSRLDGPTRGSPRSPSPTRRLPLAVSTPRVRAARPSGPSRPSHAFADSEIKSTPRAGADWQRDDGPDHTVPLAVPVAVTAARLQCRSFDFGWCSTKDVGSMGRTLSKWSHAGILRPAASRRHGPIPREGRRPSISPWDSDLEVQVESLACNWDDHGPAWATPGRHSIGDIEAAALASASGHDGAASPPHWQSTLNARDAGDALDAVMLGLRLWHRDTSSIHTGLAQPESTQGTDHASSATSLTATSCRAAVTGATIPGSGSSGAHQWFSSNNLSLSCSATGHHSVFRSVASQGVVGSRGGKEDLRAVDRQDGTGKAPARHSVGTSRSDSTTGRGTGGNASVLGASVATPRHWHQHDSVNSTSDHRRRARGPGTAITSTVRRHQAVGIYELDEDQEPCQEEA